MFVTAARYILHETANYYPRGSAGGILPALRNRQLVFDGRLAFCLLFTIGMDDKNTWWQKIADALTHMGKKAWIAVGVIAFSLVGITIWNALRASNHGSWPARLDQEEKIKDMEDRVGRLQKELDDASKQIASLQRPSEETTRGRRSEQRSEHNSRREQTRQADQSPSQAPSMYETARSTSVYEEPSASSRKLTTIPRGSRVRVVGSDGDWLEVRSKQGRPPGFILKEDAVLAR